VVSGIDRPRTNTCAICGEGTIRPTNMCRDCEKSYDRSAFDDGSVMAAILWAARRSRWYAERRRGARRTRRAIE